MQTRTDGPSRSVPSILFLALAVLPAATAAQIVQGQVVDSVSGTAVGTGFIAVLDSMGNEIGRVLTARDGSFAIRLPAPQSIRLRSERIAYRAAVTSPLAVDQGETVERTVRIVPLPVRLTDIRVERRRRCALDGAADEGLAVVWEEARKALAAASWTRAGRLYRYDNSLYERVLDRRRRRVENERTWTTTKVITAPFRSRQASALVADGYVVGDDEGMFSYYAPDADVLLHESFLRTHCFTITRDEDDRPGLVGLAFEPAPDRDDHSDIEGELWLDETTSELRSLEFRYTRLPNRLRESRAGGSLRFTPITSGAWVISEWQIRMPLIELEAREDIGATLRARLQGFHDVGAEITRIQTPDGRVVYASDFSTLAGVVYDSTRHVPLTGATVMLTGTDHWSVTDTQGRYRISGPLNGEYTVQVSHPRLDSLGVTLDAIAALVTDDTREQTLSISVPAVPRIVASHCGGASLDPGRRVLVGYVRDEATLRAVAGATVTSRWEPLTRTEAPVVSGGAETTTDGTGFFALCDVPSNHRVALHAADSAAVSRFNLIVVEDTILHLPRNRSVTVDHPMWRQDLLLSPRDDGLVRITGRITVRDSTRAVAGAAVRMVNTRDTARTDSIGIFRLNAVIAGVHQLEVSHPRFRPVRFALEVPPVRELRLPDDALTLDPRPTALDPILVTAEADEPNRNLALAGFYDRRKRGFGSFMTREEFRTYSPSRTTQILRWIPGIRVRTNPNYGRFFTDSSAIDTRPYIVESSRTSVTSDERLECPVRFFLNGIYMGNSRDDHLDTAIPVDDLTAVEVYVGAQVPARFQVEGSACGVVVFWTQ